LAYKKPEKDDERGERNIGEKERQRKGKKRIEREGNIRGKNRDELGRTEEN
jgi:hypothetical protein